MSAEPRWPEQVAAGVPTDSCWHCDGTGRVGKCDHEWHDHPQRGIRLCWLCGRPELLTGGSGVNDD